MILYGLAILLSTIIGFLIFGYMGALLGFILSELLCSILLISKSYRPLSEIDIKRFEKKYSRPITDDDTKSVQVTFKNYGIIGLVVFAIIIISIISLLFLNTLSM